MTKKKQKKGKALAATAPKKPCKPGKPRNRKAGNAPVKPAKKSAPPAPKKQTKPATKGSARLTRPKKDVFDGATSVEILPNSIAVTRKTSQSKNGKFTSSEKREYIERTEANIRKLDAAMKGNAIKKVRIDFKKAK